MKIMSNDRYELMKIEKERLEERIDYFRLMCKEKQEENLKLKGENEGLIKENKRLRKKLAKLGGDSND